MPAGADGQTMGFPAVLRRLVLVSVAACALAVAGATVALAATGAPATELVVPDVRRQAFVFAKGTLEEAGFAWRVRGPVQGYAANTVAAQIPAPGTRVHDTGAPTIVLTLRRNARYAESGSPENTSPYRGTAARSTAARVRAVAVGKPPAKPRPKAQPKPKRKPAAKRPPAFRVPGAPKEPLDEITLLARARNLEAWLPTHPQPSEANVRHWLYQHAWIVTGARFGWSHGEAALRILVGVDRTVEARWGLGSRSRAVAEQALVEVREQSR